MGNFYKKTVRDVELRGKRVLLRADYNVPINDGKIADDYRLRQSLLTIDYILKQSPEQLVIISHLGRPKSAADKECSLFPVAKRLADLLGQKVDFMPECVGQKTSDELRSLPPGRISLLENLRFHPEEEKNDKDFAKEIVETTAADVFVQDGFGVVHRAHASTEAITHLLPSVAGLLLETEVETINKVMNSPERPLTAVIGGAKISDKIDVLNRFLEIADCVAIGGALANNFLHVQKFDTGQSLVEPETYAIAKEVIAKARRIERERQFNFIIPVDVVVSTDASGRARTRIVDLAAHTVADIEAYPKKPQARAYTLLAGEKIFDIGPISAGVIAGAVSLSKTVIWSGPLGVAETHGIAGAAAPFGHGTKLVVDAMISSSNSHANKPFSVVGGGDTVSYVENQGLVQDFNHVSTGGSASLELMAGNKLPGVEALENK